MSRNISLDEKRRLPKLAPIIWLGMFHSTSAFRACKALILPSPEGQPERRVSHGKPR
jgi:hypothetical protein